jgi:hypothetical protein
MQVQVLAPGVEDGEETDFGAQMLGIAGNREEGFGGGAGEDIVDHFFVMEGDGGERLGDGEDHVEILHGQQLGGAPLEPLGARRPLALGAVPVAAGAVLNVGIVAVVAPSGGAAQGRGAAVLDGPHQAMLMQGQSMGLPVRRTMLPKDVGHLQGGPWHGRLSAESGAGWPGPCGRGCPGD